MRELEYAGAFKRDYKREKKGLHRGTVAADLEVVLALLAADVALGEAYSDHDLSGDWAGYRECHIKPDLLLIYSKAEVGILRLSRLGSHSELF
ncbi:mRNA interferase YafQ [Janthinobacterium sp. CG_23.3]|uniref:type II toxin-antitoxin system YafQ family toxin n=1 Tax=Janthinobacterium sp. CG_23.3 TaxID=3349634 RepID=UPI0038D3B2C4